MFLTDILRRFVALPKLLLTAEVKPCSQVLLLQVCNNVQECPDAEAERCHLHLWRKEKCSVTERRDWTSSSPLQHHQYSSCRQESPGPLKHIHLAANSGNALIHHGAVGTAADKLGSCWQAASTCESGGSGHLLVNLVLNIGVGEGESDHVWIVSCPEHQGSPAPSSGERQASSQSHGEGRGRRLQLLVQQAEQHSAPVTLGGLTQ